MVRLLLIGTTLAALAAPCLSAQTALMRHQPGAPAAGITCTDVQLYKNDTNGDLYRCRDGVFALLSTVGAGTDVASYPGADAGEQLANCHAALAATGGICDARSLTGAQTVSSQITFTKPIQILLGAATWSSAVANTFVFAAGSGGSWLSGLGSADTLFSYTAASGAMISVGATVQVHRLGYSGFRLSATANGGSGIVIGSTAQAWDDNLVRSNYIFRDLYLVGAGAASTGVGLSLTETNAASIENIASEGFGTGVLFDRTGAGSSFNVKVENNVAGVTWQKGDAPGNSDDVMTKLNLVMGSNSTSGVKIDAVNVTNISPFYEQIAGTATSYLRVTSNGGNYLEVGGEYASAGGTLTNTIVLDNSFNNPTFINSFAASNALPAMSIGTASVVVGLDTTQAKVIGCNAWLCDDFVAAGNSAKVLMFGFDSGASAGNWRVQGNVEFDGNITGAAASTGNFGETFAAGTGQTAGNAQAFRTYGSGEAVRWQVRNDGVMAWCDGTTCDISLERTFADTLTLNDSLVINGGRFTNGTVAFASLGAPGNAQQVYCSNCDTPAAPGNTCATGGDSAGAMAIRIRGAWSCF